MEARAMRSIYMALGEETERLLVPLRSSVMSRCILGFTWCLLHLLVSIIQLGSHLIQVIVCYITSIGFLKRYQQIQLHKLQHLAVVVDSEEAKKTKEIKQLLHCLSDIGVKDIILYDMEGVLKKSLGTNQISLASPSGNSKSCSCKIQDSASNNVISRIHHGKMTIELLSLSDGKEGVVKAANFLFSNYLKDDIGGCKKIEPTFTETDMSAALKAVGYDGPDPDLLLIYGPARCHLGFPAWRMSYTEIVYMGPLKSLNYGFIVKSIYDFSKKNQNYGT